MWSSNNKSPFEFLDQILLANGTRYTILIFNCFVCFLWHVQFHMQPVVCVLLATFFGFGVAMFGNSLTVEIFNWRRRRLAQSNDRRGSQNVMQLDQPDAAANQTMTNPSHLDPEMGRSEIIHGS